jgi:hypothetical protein
VRHHPLDPLRFIAIYPPSTSERLTSAVHAHPTSQLGKKLSAVTAQLTTLSGQVTVLSGKVTALDGKVTALSGQVTVLNGRVNGVEAEMQVGNRRRLLAAEARHRNRSAMDAADALSRVPDGTGPVPSVFPETRRDLIDMTAASMNVLLAYYELSGVGHASDKRNRLFLHLGLGLRPTECY